jgi:hypothetical protein
MISMTSQAAPRPGTAVRPLRSWRGAVGLAAVAAGGAAVAGCLLPWATAFAGLVAIPGIRGGNGKLLAAAGILIAVAGIWHLIRGGTPARWVIGAAGAGVLGYSAYLLMRLTASTRSLGGDSMVLLHGGPGLWVVAAGGLIAFGTLFLPASTQAAFRAGSENGAGLAAWAADLRSAGPRRWLQIGLGLAWLADAALQYQPYMFTRGFVTQILQPAGMGSPAVVSGSVMGTGQILLTHVAIFNALFATVQLALGVGLLWRRTSRAALAGTIVWGLAVWWLGEGLGGILSGSASPVTGAPGAALLYAILAVLAWPRKSAWDNPANVAAGSRIGLRGAQLTWAVLWASSAYFILQPPNRAPGALGAAVAGQADGEPGWLAALDRGAAGAIGSNGTAISVTLAVLFLIVAVGIFVPVAARPVLVLSAVLAAAMWAVGQDFGGMLTGQGTDPGTGPLLVLLAAAFWPWRARRGAAPATRAAQAMATGTGAASVGTAASAIGFRATRGAP